MLYWLLYEKLFPFFHPFRIFRYLTFRTAFASLTALLIALFIGPWVIQKLREFQIGQFVREDGPQSHLKKTGTPTMGGVLICIAILLPTVLWSDPANPFVWITVFSTLAFGAIGFADDYIKVVQRRSLGLTARAKLFWQGLAGALVAVALVVLDQFKMFSTRGCRCRLSRACGPICCGTDGRARFRIWRWFAFVPFVLWVVLVLVGSSNAVNLTDGLDGLAIGCTIIAAGALAVLTYITRPRGLRRLSGTAAHAHGGRADGVLRVDGGRVDRLSLVQRASGGDLHGRRGLAGAGRQPSAPWRSSSGRSCCCRSLAESLCLRRSR